MVHTESNIQIVPDLLVVRLKKGRFKNSCGGNGMKRYLDIKQQLQDQVHQRLDMSREMTDEEIGEVIDDVIMEKSRESYMSAVTKLTLRQELFNSIRRLDLLQELIDDKSVTEIMVNGAESVFYERDGQIYSWDRHF